MTVPFRNKTDRKVKPAFKSRPMIATAKHTSHHIPVLTSI